jgi:hypothetical protein
MDQSWNFKPIKTHQLNLSLLIIYVTFFRNVDFCKVFSSTFYKVVQHFFKCWTTFLEFQHFLEMFQHLSEMLVFLTIFISILQNVLTFFLEMLVPNPHLLPPQVVVAPVCRPRALRAASVAPPRPPPCATAIVPHSTRTLSCTHVSSPWSPRASLAGCGRRGGPPTTQMGGSGAGSRGRGERT